MVRVRGCTTTTRTRLALAAVAAGLLATGCQRQLVPRISDTTAAATGRRAASSGTPIQHVVIVIQENRTFDDLFQGYPGANSSPTGLDHNGNAVSLSPVSLAAPYDILHGLRSYNLS
jgi:phospholipase C